MAIAETHVTEREQLISPAEARNDLTVRGRQSRRWVSEFAYFLWLAESRPEGQDKRHWQIAEAACRRHVILADSGQQVQRIAELAFNISLGEPPTAEHVALAALAARLEVGAACKWFSELFEELCNTIGEQVAQSCFQILKSWCHDLDERQQAERVADAVSRAGLDVSGSSGKMGIVGDIGSSATSLPVSEMTLRSHHPLGTSDMERASPGDFEVVVCGDQVLVPQDVAEMLRERSIHYAEEFVSFVRCFPSEVMAQLGWKHGDVIRGQDKLIAALRGVLAPQFLEPPSVPRKGYGALDPKRLRKKKH